MKFLFAFRRMNFKFLCQCGFLFFILLPARLWLHGQAGSSNVLTAQNQWTTSLPTVGTFSSPRVVDLNKDGTKDIILGAGREEFHACDSAVVALDGKTGAVLWTVNAVDQIFGSAIFKDVDDDGVADVFIGGRSAELMAISGASGKVLWRFLSANQQESYKQKKWFNFYNPQLIPDQNNDGLEDLLVSNGGDVMVEAHNPDRPPGYLITINSRNGKILSFAEMPDDKEIYMSVTISPTPDGSDHEIVFGTGGETVGGNLFVDRLSNLQGNQLANLSGTLKGAKKLHTSADKGYVGPVARVDLNEDGHKDIVCNAVDSRLLAIDGKTNQLIWELHMPETESYSSAAIGYFTPDDIPDVFVSYGTGVWPKLDWSIQRMVNGKTGQVEFVDSLGYYQMTSPLAVDLTGDGRDEVVMSLNFQEVDSVYRKFFYTTLIAIEFKHKEFVQIASIYEGHNLSSTPWVGDLDEDGFLDFIYCHGSNLRHTYTFDGIKVHRIPTKIPVYKPLQWGAYQGSNYNGIFETKKSEE